MKKNNIIIFVTIALLASCGRNTKEAEPIVRTAKIDTVRLSGGVLKSVYPGKVKSNTEASLSFRVDGTIARMPHAEGAFVRKGTLIAEMDARDYRVQLAATEAEYNQIKATAERIIELYNRGSATKSDYEKAVYGLDQITAKYNAHKNQLSDTRLLAPFDGYIQKKLHDERETVAAGMPVISMTGNKECLIEINLPVQDYARKEDFEHFEATVSTEPDKKLALELFELSPTGNANQLYRMTFRIKNPKEVSVVSGMSAEVGIKYKTEQKPVYEIPVSAIFEMKNKPHVWIFTSEDVPLKAQEVVVSEIKRNGYIVVEQGIKDGDVIVVAGVQSIREGTKVKPLPPASPSNIGGML
ncbi:MAG: efflux RND transporter periplasmic adaptor subunit [Bacteroidales bacterium]|jgi:RND family efflux transporter MFP subunit|nr:efflux RND transporter periplasmic adaptor subunit [Bacteroidales bacterium]